MRNINSRMEDSDFLDLTAVANYLSTPRSQIVRDAIKQFMQKGTLITEGKEMLFKDVLVLAYNKLGDDGIGIEELTSKRERKQEDSLFSPETKRLIQEHTDVVYERYVDLHGQKE